MSLQTAQLGQLSNIQLPTSAPQKRQSIMEQALAAFVANMGAQLGEKVMTNALSRDYAADGQKAGFFAKLGSGPVVGEKEHLMKQQEAAEALRQKAIFEQQTREGDKTRKVTTDEGRATRQHQTDAQVRSLAAQWGQFMAEQEAAREARLYNGGLVMRGQDLSYADSDANRRQRAAERAEDRPGREAQTELVKESAKKQKMDNIETGSGMYMRASFKDPKTGKSAIYGDYAPEVTRLVGEALGTPSAAQSTSSDPADLVRQRLMQNSQGPNAAPTRSVSQQVFDVNNIPKVANPSMWAIQQLAGLMSRPASGSVPKADPASPTAPQTGPSGPPTTSASSPAGVSPVFAQTKDGVMVGIDDGKGLDIGSLVSPFTGQEQPNGPAEVSPFTAPSQEVPMTEEELLEEYRRRQAVPQSPFLPAANDPQA